MATWTAFLKFTCLVPISFRFTSAGVIGLLGWMSPAATTLPSTSFYIGVKRKGFKFSWIVFHCLILDKCFCWLLVLSVCAMQKGWFEPRDLLYLKGRKKANHTQAGRGKEKGRKTRSSGNQWNIPTLWPASSKRCGAGSNPIFLASNFNMLPSDLYSSQRENLLVLEAHVSCMAWILNYRARPMSSLIASFCDWNCHDI